MIKPVLALGASALIFPAVAFAAPATFKDLVTLLVDLINASIIPLIFAITLLAFLWGVFQYMFFPDSEERKQKGKQVIVWGLVAITVMVSVWGLVNIVYNSFRFGTAEQNCIREPGNCYP